MRLHPFRFALPLTATCLAFASCSGAPDSDDTLQSEAEQRDDGPLADDSDGSDWAAFGRTYGEQHFSPLTDINTDTIERLKLAWYEDLPPGNAVSGPLAVGGILYTATGYSIVRAFDASTGKLLWEHDPGVPERAGRKLRVGWGIRGLAWWHGKLFVGTQDGRLIALEASTGKQLWSSMTVGKDDARFISGPPRVFRGKVIIGHGGADSGDTRGYVTAYDTETGRQLWRFYTVPGNPAVDKDETTRIAAKTWAGEWWTHGGGGTVWNAMTYDAEFNSILIGVGNGAPWNRRLRSADKGDNLFLTSIVALDADTGAYKWHYQTVPGETWDYNASMDMQLATLSIDDKPRKVLIQAPKNGFLYVIDRSNGKLISAEPIGRVTWAEKIDLETGRPVETADARFPDGKDVELWPGPNGVHNWLPMSLDPRTGHVYIPTLNMPGTYGDKGITPATWKRVPGNAVDVGVNFQLTSKDPTAGTGALIAWDPVKQKEVWRVPNPGFWNGGTMATAGGLIFQGHADGSFNAYDSATGRKLWSFDAQVGVLAPPITYRAGGKQYITVLAGFGSSGAGFGDLVSKFGWQYRTQQRRILTFVLDGKAALPPRQKADPVTPVRDKDFRPDTVLASAGAEIYGRRCLSCHGVDAKAAGLAPDLRASSVTLDATAFESIVRTGLLVPNGMPRFEEMTEDQLHALRFYIRSEAQK